MKLAFNATTEFIENTVWWGKLCLTAAYIGIWVTIYSIA